MPTSDYNPFKPASLMGISFSKENPDRWYQLLWFLCVITLPMQDTYNNACIIFLGVHWLIDKSIFKNGIRIKTEKWSWPFFAYFVWLLVGLFYTLDLENGWATIDKKSSFFALPLIAVTGRALSEEFVSFLKRCFVYACLTVVLVCFAASLYNYLKGNNTASFDFNFYPDFVKLHPDAPSVWSKFSYIQLIQWAGLHPTYFAMYLAFCLCILFTEHFQTKLQESIHLVIGVVIGIFFALLSTRIAIIAFFIAVAYLILSRLVLKKQSRSILSITVICSLIISLLWLNPVSRFRMAEEPAKTSYEINRSTTNWNSVNYRLLEWQGSWAVIADHFLFGVGTGGWQVAMSNFYHGFNESTADLEHNAHNEYLQTWMENGLPGMIVFLCCIAYPFVLKKSGPDYVAFLIIFIIMCATESITERQKGIVFFTLFQSLYLMKKK